jgi:hypothetical protein
LAWNESNSKINKYVIILINSVNTLAKLAWQIEGYCRIPVTDSFWNVFMANYMQPLC